MKILLISNMYPGSDTPHLGGFVKNAADSLRNNGHDIELCVLNKISKSKVTKIYNYLVFYISILVKVLLTKSDCLYLHYASHCYLPVKMGNYVRRKKIVVHVHGGDVKRLNGTSGMFFRVKKAIVSNALKNAVKIVFPSKSYLEFTKNEYQLDEVKCAISPSGGVDTQLFAFKNREFGAPLKLLFAGRLIKSKRVDLAIQAIENLSDDDKSKIHLTIVGDGPELGSLVKSAAHLPNIEFSPAVGHVRLAEIFQEHDVLIYPSESESLGLVPLEAMATGMIPLLSNIPSFNEFIDNNQNGFIVYEDGYYKIKIEQMLEMSPQTLQAMSHQAKQTVLNSYTKEIAQTKLLEAFKCL